MNGFRDGIEHIVNDFPAGNGVRKEISGQSRAYPTPHKFLHKKLRFPLCHGTEESPIDLHVEPCDWCEPGERDWFVFKVLRQLRMVLERDQQWACLMERNHGHSAWRNGCRAT